MAQAGQKLHWQRPQIVKRNPTRQLRRDNHHSRHGQHRSTRFQRAQTTTPTTPAASNTAWAVNQLCCAAVRALSALISVAI